LNMRSNVVKYYAFKFFSFLFFFNPVFVVFLQENGLSMTQVLALQSVFSIVIVFLEIPTGAVGDYFGRKTSIATGAFLFSLCMFIYSAGSTFWVFLAAELIGGVGIALISGSDSALIYATLKQDGRESEYARIEGNATAWMQTGILAASILGGIIGNFSTRMTLAASGVSSLAACAISLSIKEPQTGTESRPRDSYRTIIVRSLVIVREHRLVLWIFFYVSLVGSIILLCQWFYQPFFMKVGVGLVHFGWIYTALGIVSIIASKMTGSIEKSLGSVGSLAFLAVIMIVCYLGIGSFSSKYAILFFSLHQIYLGTARTILGHRVLSVVPEDKSATILSIAHLGNRFFYAAAGPLFGYLVDSVDLSFSLVCLGGCLAVITIGLFAAYRRVPEHFRRQRNHV